MGGIRDGLKKIGPGILFASMAVGTSHLVLSTKAGASYGWIMVIPIILANVLKYPFFQYGVRFSEATGRSLIEGYYKENPWFLRLYAAITVLNAISIPAALYLVTAQLLGFVLGTASGNPAALTLILIAIISILLVVGKYRFLENSLKILVALLLAILIYAVTQVGISGAAYPDHVWEIPRFSGPAEWLFMMSLIGWMPTAVETAAWVSMWTVEKKSDKTLLTSFRESMLEFDFGYALTAVLALMFFFMGWYVLYGSDTVFELSGAGFSRQFAMLFSSQLGHEFRLLIAFAAFATMLSSAMTAHDGLARVSVECYSYLGIELPHNRKRKLTGLLVVVIGLVNMGVIRWFSSDMGTLITAATFISFVFAPLIGWLNLRTVTRNQVPPKLRPGRFSRTWSWLGIGILGALAVAYMLSLFLPA